MKSGMVALVSVVALCAFLLLGGMLMTGAVADLNPNDVPEEFTNTSTMMQQFFPVFNDWNWVLIWIVALTALVVGLWFILRFK